MAGAGIKAGSPGVLRNGIECLDAARNVCPTGHAGRCLLDRGLTDPARLHDGCMKSEKQKAGSEEPA
jgi:hypothetical protein